MRTLLILIPFTLFSIGILGKDLVDIERFRGKRLADSDIYLTFEDLDKCKFKNQFQ